MADYESARDRMALGMTEVSDAIASFEWDLEEAKILHLDLSRRMNDEMEILRRLGPAPQAAPASAADAACPMSWDPSAAGPTSTRD